MAAELTDVDKRFFQDTNFGHLATLSPDGSPQSTAVWVDVEDGLILVNTTDRRAKKRNTQRDPRVAISVTDKDNPYKMVSIRGRVIEQTEEGAAEHIDMLAKKYTGQDYWGHRPDVARVILKIQPERIYRYGYESS